MDINNQQQHWNELHRKGSIYIYSEKPTELAESLLKKIKPESHILDLGCGLGNDSVAFARAGHIVLATDFSDVAIAQDNERYKDIKYLTFMVLYLSEHMELVEDSFDVVYARLSLQYFTDAATRKIFSQIHKTLKQGGYFCFMCKSTDDPLYGKGTELEKDMYEYQGHVRHFFSEEYTKSLLQNDFTIETFEAGKSTLYGDDSAFIKVIAKSVV